MGKLATSRSFGDFAYKVRLKHIYINLKGGKLV